MPLCSALLCQVYNPQKGQWDELSPMDMKLCCAAGETAEDGLDCRIALMATGTVDDKLRWFRTLGICGRVIWEFGATE